MYSVIFLQNRNTFFKKIKKMTDFSAIFKKLKYFESKKRCCRINYFIDSANLIAVSKLQFK